MSFEDRLQAIFAGASWNYAIFWEHSAAESLLVWGDGYYKGGEDDTSSCLAEEQEHRKKVLRQLNSTISGSSYKEYVTDIQWFYLLSMCQSFEDGEDVQGESFFSNQAVWIAGQDQFSSSTCDRVRYAQLSRLQTMVCIPLPNGVVELGSSNLIVQSHDLMNQVRVLFNGSNATNQTETPPPPNVSLENRQRLKAIIDSVGESWTYAIFWQHSAAKSRLGWGGGYLKKNLPNSLIFHDAVPETGWFFFLSRNEWFVKGVGLPGQSFFSNDVAWIAGQDRLSSLTCERVRNPQLFGLQTMVCIPLPNGVVELGSSDLIFWNPGLMNQVKVFFNGSNATNQIEAPPPPNVQQIQLSQSMEKKNQSIFGTNDIPPLTEEPNVPNDFQGQEGDYESEPEIHPKEGYIGIGATNEKKGPTRKTTSIAWQGMTKFDKTLDDGTIYIYARCKTCSREFPADSKKNGTAKLISHLKRCPGSLIYEDISTSQREFLGNRGVLSSSSKPPLAKRTKH